ncbi:hypothetical protein V6N13_065660 [Hibiscus sabdariffa]|uniref:Uncharacterized protein n=1 Tax=Hibiscus sabdariffa TaxID=183260 RepID=A0ABR2QQ76_9ROSI
MNGDLPSNPSAQFSAVPPGRPPDPVDFTIAALVSNAPYRVLNADGGMVPMSDHPSFRDMVVGREEASATVSNHNPRVEPTTDERFGPWMQVTNKRRKLNVNQRDPTLAATGNSHDGGSCFAVVRGVVDEVPRKPSSGERLAHQAVDSTVNTSELLPSVSGGGSVSVPLAVPVRKASVAIRTTVEFMEMTEQPSDGCTEGLGDVITLVAVAGQETGETTRVIAAKGKVVLGPSSLKPDKHIAIRVVEENDISSRILKENNNRVMYGPICSATTRGAKRVSVAAKPLPRKDVTGKKRGELSRHPITMNDWASNLSRSLTAEGQAVASSKPKDTRSPVGSVDKVTWVDNSSYEENTLPSQQ